MGVIVRLLNGSNFEYYCKGSPEMILNFVKKETIPQDFHDILESYTQEGYRVIAMAHKKLKLNFTKVWPNFPHELIFLRTKKLFAGSKSAERSDWEGFGLFGAYSAWEQAEAGNFSLYSSSKWCQH